MKVIYRISDGGFSKIKPPYVSKRQTFLHFIKIFAGYDIYVIADNVSEDTYRFLCKYIDSLKILRSAVGNSQSFLLSAMFATQSFNDDEKVYFAEDDYIYTKEAPKVLEEGLDIADYVSGYDHPDKYVNAEDGGNPLIREGGEITRVMITKTRHWKMTNSFCMTFGVRVKTIKEDFNTIVQFCQHIHPEDYKLFTELRKKRKLISCLPAVCTHGETLYLAPFVDWEKEAANKIVHTNI